MRPVRTAIAAGALAVAPASAAFAHAELAPYQLPPGVEAGLQLLVTHGCGDEDEWISAEPMPEEPTTAITIVTPLELAMSPAEIDGWTLTTETDEAGRVTASRWDMDDPGGTSDTVAFPVNVTIPDLPNGSQVWVPVVQECTAGQRLDWTLEGDLRGGDEVPAMRLIINENSAAPEPWEVDGSAVAVAPGSDGVPAATVAVSVALAVAGVAAGAFALRRRRVRSTA